MARYQLENPYGDGTTHVFFEPLDFISRLAAQVPKPPVIPASSPGQILTHYQEVFAPNSHHCTFVMLAWLDRGHKATVAAPEATSVASHAAMRWAQRLKRVFDIGI